MDGVEVLSESGRREQELERAAYARGVKAGLERALQIAELFEYAANVEKRIRALVEDSWHVQAVDEGDKP